MSAPLPSRRQLTKAALAATLLGPLACLIRPANAEDDPLLTIGHPGGTTELPRSVIETMALRTISTATPWTEGISAFEGPLLRDVLARAGIGASSGTTIVARALNDYVVDMPLADAFDHDVIVATRENGLHMPLRKRGPFFILYPLNDPALWNERYFSRCAWQLRSLDVS